ncbi:MAG: BlaI/MecI/CopY family transcriptional regulator [Lachnospiraceae bacterium]|nr:BlaI/MecI/CopY family transcriptional regulator [Lachnospiraceae bacterium]
MERKSLSTRQHQIMEILWNANSGMTASAIVNAREDLQINTVQASLRSLMKKKYIKVGEIVYSGTVLSRSYVPIVSREEYMTESCQELSRLSSSVLLASLIHKEDDENLLDELSEMIRERKREIEKGE